MEKPINPGRNKDHIFYPFFMTLSTTYSWSIDSLNPNIYSNTEVIKKIEFFSHQKSIICNECCFGGGVIQSPNQIAILPYNILDCHERYYAPTL